MLNVGLEILVSDGKAGGSQSKSGSQIKSEVRDSALDAGRQAAIVATGIGAGRRPETQVAFGEAGDRRVALPPCRRSYQAPPLGSCARLHCRNEPRQVVSSVFYVIGLHTRVPMRNVVKLLH